jgi:hypothetical protein
MALGAKSWIDYACLRGDTSRGGVEFPIHLGTHEWNRPIENDEQIFNRTELQAEFATKCHDPAFHP